jgi:ATP-dependent DNA helicase RecG
MSDYTDRASFRSIDTLPLRDVSIDHIDMERVAAHVTRATERGRYAGTSDPTAYLLAQHYVVTEEGQMLATPAAVLCFGRNPQEIFPRAVVDMVHYRGVDSLSYEVVHIEKGIGGTVFDQIARVESYLWANTHHGMTLDSESSARVELHEYPREVIRELGVNMVAHRDYENVMTAARVLLFRNRIEWSNPGGLPEGITVENILKEQASRNPGIVEILYQSGYVEAVGQGIDTVLAVLARASMAPPQFHDSGTSFRATVHGRPLDFFSENDIFARLNERQRRIVAFIRSRGETTPTEIATIFGDTVSERTIQRDLQELVQGGLMSVTGGRRGRGRRYYVREDVG